MTIIIRNPDQSIHSFHQFNAGIVLAKGQTLEEVDQPFEDYAERLVLSVSGITGRTISVEAQPGRIVRVDVSCPGQQTVAIDINGLAEEVPLQDGAGILELEADVPGLFILRPADRTLHCAAGNATLAVEVTDA